MENAISMNSDEVVRLVIVDRYHLQLVFNV